MNIMQVLQQLQQVKELVSKSGKSPQEYLDTVINSGQYSQSQINQAKEMAAMLQNILQGGRK